MLKLGCVNCGAPLEIRADLDVFACAYCGTQQQVQRQGGVVALRRVESAIRAVQRGTDRTAAELAMPRLQAELTGLYEARARLLADASARFEAAVRGRRYLTLVAFAMVVVGGLTLASAVDGAKAQILNLLWLLSCVVVPVVVYRKVKMPTDNSGLFVRDIDERITRVNAHIEANRAILDQMPI